MRIEIFSNLSEPLKKELNIKKDFQSLVQLHDKINKKTIQSLAVPFFNISISDNNQKIVFIAFEDNDIVGSLCLGYEKEERSSFNKCCWLMKNIGVAKSHQGRHFSTAMIKSMFETADNLGISGISQTYYSTLGWKRVKNNFAKYSELYPQVKFIDGKRRFE